MIIALEFLLTASARGFDFSSISSELSMDSIFNKCDSTPELLMDTLAFSQSNIKTHKRDVAKSKIFNELDLSKVLQQARKFSGSIRFYRLIRSELCFPFD